VVVLGERVLEQRARVADRVGAAALRAVQVTEGEPVEKGQTLLLLEAMKMEIRLSAPRSGKVSRLLVQAGQIVQRDQVLVEIT